MHTYGIIKIIGSLHHTIANLEPYFTIAFSGAFLAFFSAKRGMTLSKLICLAISDSMLSLAISTKRSCDLVERKQFCTSFSLQRDLSAEATEAGIVSKIRKLTQIFGKRFLVYIDKDCLINLKKNRVKQFQQNILRASFYPFAFVRISISLQLN